MAFIGTLYVQYTSYISGAIRAILVHEAPVSKKLVQLARTARRVAFGVRQMNEFFGDWSTLKKSGL